MIDGGKPPVAGQPAQNIAETALQAGMQLARKPIGTAVQDAKQFIVLLDADGRERVEYLEQRFEAPARKIGLVILNDEASFIEFWKSQKTEASRIYAKLDPARFLAVFDDHNSSPAYRGYRAEYTPAFSREWQTWNGKNRQPFSGNEEFALWLEDQLPDIVRPDGGKMLEIALNFRVNQAAAFSNAVRLEDGNTQLTFNNTVEASAKIESKTVKIPEEFDISIPVFEGLGAPKYAVKARFRHRLNAGRLSLWYELIRPHKVVEEAFKATLDTIAKATKVVPLFGSPEKG